MSKSIALGLLMQCISAVGYLAIVNVTSIRSEAFRTGIMILFASVAALIVTGFTVATGRQELSAIQAREYLLIAVGSVMVMFVAQALFFYGVRLSNMTTMTLTLLALPFITLLLEVLLGRIELSSLGWRELLGFALISAGYVIYVARPQP